MGIFCPHLILGLNLLSMISTMLSWQQLFVFSMTPYNTSRYVCQGVAVSLHYLILSTFFWTHVMAWDLYQTFGQKAIFSQIRSRKYFKSYALYAWGTPLGIRLFHLTYYPPLERLLLAHFWEMYQFLCIFVKRFLLKLMFLHWDRALKRPFWCEIVRPFCH